MLLKCHQSWETSKLQPTAASLHLSNVNAAVIRLRQKVPVYFSALELFSFYSTFFICRCLLGIFRELSLRAVQVSPEWKKVLNQCEMLSERGGIYISFILCGWLQRIMSLLFIQRQKGKTGEKVWPNCKHHCKQLRGRRVMQTQLHKMEGTLLKAAGKQRNRIFWHHQKLYQDLAM